MIKRCLLALIFGAFIFQLKADAQTKLGTKEIKKLMQGAWWGAEDSDAAVFYIGGDSVTYIEDFDKFQYIISKDTFDLKTDQIHYKELILRISADSLILKELPSGEINKYWRSN